MRRAVQPRLSAESGFWKTIWMERLSAVGRLGGRRRRAACSSSSSALPASGLSMPRMVLARVDLPEPDSPTSPSVSPSNSSRSTLTRAGTSWPLWWKVLDTFEQRQARSPWIDRLRRRSGGGSTISPEAVAVVAARPAPAADARRSAARRSGTARRPAGSGRRRRRSAGPSRSGAGCRGSSTAPARSLRMPWRGSERSRPRV